MDVQQRLDDIVAAVEGARSMPMSASCVVNRAELLDMLGEVREALPGSLAQAQELLGGREQMVAEAQQESRRIIEEAQRERSSLVAQTEVARLAQQESDRILGEARREAEEIRAEADDYVDSKLANFEVVLSKTIGAVDRGRDKLLGRTPSGDAGPEGEEVEEALDSGGQDPEARKQRAEEYIEAQFRAFEAVLAKTLQAVGRGRQKLTGHRPIDDLAAHMAAQPEAETSSRPQGSDEEYLAGLVDNSPERGPAPVSQSQPQAPPGAGYAQPAAGYAEPGAAQPGAQDPYGYPAAPPAPGPDHSAPPADYYPAVDPGASRPYAAQGYQEPGYQQDPYQQGAQEYPAYDGQGAYPEQSAYGQGQYGYGELGGYQQDPQQEQYGQGHYAPQQPGGYYPQQGQQPQAGQQPAALDETSFFDTSMIDMEQLRRYEQGRE